MTSPLSRARRIVVKVGSALLVDGVTGTVKRQWLDSLAADLKRLRDGGAQVLIVSSGAIALGRRVLKLPQIPVKLEDKQAAAAVGQIALAQAWSVALGRSDLITGQILLTLYDTEERRRYLNARATMTTLLAQGVVPVINENDTVATSEIRYGDNDRLAARVASMMSADCLVLLSDIDGLYSAPPDQPDAEHIPEVTGITPAIEAMAGEPVSGDGSGGMVTKLAAGRIATGAGARMVIASGHESHPLARIMDGARCTWFQPVATPVQARKRWIAGTLTPVAQIVVDQGAAAALARGTSLLPAGVTAIEGTFTRGDPVRVVTGQGVEIARGLVAYDHEDARRIAGRQSGEIGDVLGFRGRDEMIHRDDLVLTGKLHHEPC